MGCSAVRGPPPPASNAAIASSPPPLPQQQPEETAALLKPVPAATTAAVATAAAAVATAAAAAGDGLAFAGIAFEYLKSLPGQDRLAAVVFGDHDAFCAKVSQFPGTAHLVRATADVYVTFPHTCTLQQLLQTLNAFVDSSCFLWLEGARDSVVLGNDAAAAAEYEARLTRVLNRIGKVVGIVSPFHEPACLSPSRALELSVIDTVVDAQAAITTNNLGGVHFYMLKSDVDELSTDLCDGVVGVSKFERAVHRTIRSSEFLPAAKRHDVLAACEQVFSSALLSIADDILARNVQDEKKVNLLYGRASLHFVQGEYEHALRKFRQALELCAKTRDWNAAKIALLHNVAATHERLNQKDEAVKVYEECLNLERPEKQLRKPSMMQTNHSSNGSGGSSSNLTQVVPNAAVVASNQERQSTPRGSNAKQMTDMWRDSFTVPQRSDPGYAITLNNLACLYAEKGAFDQAQALFEECLLYAKRGREESPLVAYCLRNMGIFFEEFSRIPLARDCYAESLAIRRKHSAFSSSSRGDGAAEMSGEALEANVQLGEALYLLGTFMLSTTEVSSSTTSAAASSPLLQECQPLLEEALALYTQSFGRESEQVVKTLLALADMWRKVGGCAAPSLAAAAPAGNGEEEEPTPEKRARDYALRAVDILQALSQIDSPPFPPKEQFHQEMHSIRVEYGLASPKAAAE